MEINILALVLFIAGLGFMVWEMLTPGLGIPSLLGIICFIAAVIIQSQSVAEAFILSAIVLVLVVIMLLVTLRSVDRGKIHKSDNLVLKSEITQTGNDYTVFLNKTGVADSDLRPSGTAIIDEMRMDVVAEGKFISRGSSVYVSAVDGMRIVVKEVEPE